jgi:hypothetical protein
MDLTIYSLSLFQGGMMEAQINDRQLPKFRPLLQENQAYYINHFLVLGARKVYRQVENDYMLGFTAFTGVFKVAQYAQRVHSIFSHLAFPR